MSTFLHRFVVVGAAGILSISVLACGSTTPATGTPDGSPIAQPSSATSGWHVVCSTDKWVSVAIPVGFTSTDPTVFYGDSDPATSKLISDAGLRLILVDNRPAVDHPGVAYGNEYIEVAIDPYSGSATADDLELAAQAWAQHMIIDPIKAWSTVPTTQVSLKHVTLSSGPAVRVEYLGTGRIDPAFNDAAASSASPALAPGDDHQVVYAILYGKGIAYVHAVSYAGSYPSSTELIDAVASSFQANCATPSK